MTLGTSRQTLAQRLLADYRATGRLPRISGGDHEGEGESGDDENQGDQNGNAATGGEQGERSGDNGFKAITSQAELDNIIGRRLDRERKKLAKDIEKDVRAAITDEATQAEAKKQGDYKKLFDDLQPKYDELSGTVDTLQAENESLTAYFTAQYDAALTELPDVITAFKPDDDASFAVKSKWLTTAQEQAKALDKQSLRGNGPNPKAGDGTRDLKTAYAEARANPKYSI